MSQAQVVDVQGEDKVFVRVHAEDNEGPLVDDPRYIELPEDIVTQLKEFLGDGKARVSVSDEFACSAYGNKSGAHVSVSVACGNSEPEIVGAHGVARALVEQLLQENYERVDQLYRDLTGQSSGSQIAAQQPAPPPQSANVPLSSDGRPVEPSTAVPSKVIARPKADAGTNRPQFKR